jgi:hypothetical protein
MLAALGLYELWGGHVTNKILVAVAIEIAFASACVLVNEDADKLGPRVASITPIKKRRSK